MEPDLAGPVFPGRRDVVRVRGLAYGDGPRRMRAFVERVRAVSGHPVIYAELPGAHHDLDVYESIRSAAISRAVEQFIVRVSTAPA